MGRPDKRLGGSSTLHSHRQVVGALGLERTCAQFNAEMRAFAETLGATDKIAAAGDTGGAGGAGDAAGAAGAVGAARPSYTHTVQADGSSRFEADAGGAVGVVVLTCPARDGWAVVDCRNRFCQRIRGDNCG